ncbi:phospholipase D family protein [Citricoccus parietis]|uniref:Phospholipase D family protein n=1 Tax=Citricoccus parietis TaxID=592307 RepID=A0ABV5FU42_9MICC
MPAWTGGNTVRLLPHGDAYFGELARELAATGPGDLVLVAGWRMDADQRLGPHTTDQRLGPHTTVAQALVASARRGALVRGLVWRSHPSWIVGSRAENLQVARRVNRAGGQVLLDHRIRSLGSHHQKFVVVRRPGDPARDVAFVGGLDLARSRNDDLEHGGDPLRRKFAEAYGPTPAWHDVQVAVRGPAVRDVEEVFRERWSDPAPMTWLPWQRLHDALSGLPQRTSPLPAPAPAPPAQGQDRVQLLRTYPRRRADGYPFAPDGEFSVARGFVKAMEQAQHLVYIEDQYLWSAEVGRILDAALRRAPELRILAVCPRYPDQEGLLKVPPSLLGQGLVLRTLSPRVRDRVTLLDLENAAGRPIYVHAKLCVIDDVWACVGSANLNRRSWTHDSELSVAVTDGGDADTADRPGGTFARELRLRLMREHLGRAGGGVDDGDDLADAAQAVRVLQASAAALDSWYDGGRQGPRPPGRLRSRLPERGAAWQRALVRPFYHAAFDPDGRPPGKRLRRRY